LAAEPEVFVPVFAAELCHEAVVLAAEPEVFVPVFAAELCHEAVVWAAELEVVSVSEPQTSVDIAAAFVVLVPVSVVAVEVDSSERPKFLAFPNVDHFANLSSSVELVG
jgi:hypothetical protein